MQINNKSHYQTGIFASPDKVDSKTVINEGMLRLSNVAIDGNIIMNVADTHACISAKPGQFGEDAIFNGKLVAKPCTHITPPLPNPFSLSTAKAR